MSAYGTITKPTSDAAPLQPTVWKVRSASQDGAQKTQFVVMHHITLANAPPTLVDVMYKEFADEIERGNTYPQEVAEGARYTREDFEAYYFAADVMIGLQVSEKDIDLLDVKISDIQEEQGLETLVTIDQVKNGRPWEECIAGFYYVKPNYPGRGSHICNAGFVVPLSARGKGYARILARSYLHYAPKLGYQASVFNLVYVNNIASIRLWESLDFVKVGKIPQAGRLKRKDGDGEEYVDAWVFYRSFT